VHDLLGRELAGRYVIERELGRGGMATVWLARDLRHDRPVALKVLHPELAGAIGIDRFLREIRLTAQLQHSGIVPMLDSGVIDASDGGRLPWYTMPYIEGESLRSRLAREGQLPIGDALRITREVAAALKAAHQRGIVHRDIKPENLLLSGPSVYVADFGVAKALSGEERLTSTGLSIGTPAYMSPEQASAGELDARSDQYSLACVLYEMLSGEPPFTGPTAQAIIARRFAEPARPLRPVRSTVPPPVEQALLRALERSPVDRFEDVAAFAEALNAPAAERPATSPHRSWTGVLILLGLAAVSISVWIVLRPEPAAGRPAPLPEVVELYRRGMRGYDQRTTTGAQEALAAFRAALARDSSYAPAWNGLARNYLQAHRRQFVLPGLTRDTLVRLAVAASDRALAGDSTSSLTWLTRGEVARTVDPTRMRVPILASRRAIAADSNSGPAWQQLAVSLADSGDLTAGLDAWRENARRNPSFPQALAFLALGHYWRRQYDSAALWADSALAQAYAALGDAGRAVGWLSRYTPGDDRHFQLHLRCDPPFDPIARDSRFRALLIRPRPEGKRGC